MCSSVNAFVLTDFSSTVFTYTTTAIRIFLLSDNSSERQSIPDIRHYTLTTLLRNETIVHCMTNNEKKVFFDQNLFK